MKEFFNLRDKFKKTELSRIIFLTNSDFKKGTYRITKPGHYKIKEDIIFSPNENIYTSKTPLTNNLLDNFIPLESQEYYKMPPYHLGFFAAITVESDNVIIDLNNYSIRQSKLHYINQRFFSIIQLNETPFISTQGPSNFGEIDFYKNIWIRNGQ